MLAAERSILAAVMKMVIILKVKEMIQMMTLRRFNTTRPMYQRIYFVPLRTKEF